MKKASHVSMTLALALSVMSVPVYASTGVPIPTPTDSTEIKVDGQVTEPASTESTESAGIKDSPEAVVQTGEVAKPVPAVVTDVKPVAPVTAEVKKDTQKKVVKLTTSSKETDTEKVSEEKKPVSDSVTKEDTSKEEVKKFVEDKTKAVSKDGIPVEISNEFWTGGYIPSFTLILRDGGGKILSETPVGKQNFVKETKSYRVVLKHGGFKLGDKLRIQFVNPSSGVSELKLTSNLESIKNDKQILMDYNIKPTQYMPFTILPYEYMVDEEKGTWGREYSPSIYNPIRGSIVTSSKDVGITVVTKSGTPVKNATVYLRFNRDKEMKLKTDNSGMVWFPENAVTGSKFFVSVLKHTFTSGDESVKELNLFENGSKALASYTLEVDEATPISVASVTNGTVALDVVKDGNTTISSNWLESDIVFTDSKGKETKVTVNGSDVNFNLDSGVYKVRAVSDYANVKLSKTSVTVGKKGKVNLSATLSPKYVLQIGAEGGQYKYKFLNVDSVVNKTYTGTKTVAYGVVPGESYMVQDKLSSTTHTVVIDKKSTVTQLVFGKGVVYGGDVSNPHTGDAILYLFLMLAVALVASGISWSIYSKNRRLKQAVLTTIATLTGLGGILPLFSVHEVLASVGSGTSAKVTYSESEKLNTIMIDPEAAFAVSFDSASIYENELVSDAFYLSPKSGKSHLKVQYPYMDRFYALSFFVAPNKVVYDRLAKSDTALSYYTDDNRVQDLYGDSNLPFKTGTSSKKFRSDYALDGNFKDKLISSAYGSKPPTNAFDKFMWDIMNRVGKNSTNRQIWTGVNSTSSRNVGDAISVAYKDMLEVKEGDSASVIASKRKKKADIAYAYLDKVDKLTGDKDFIDFLKSDYESPDTNYVFTFKTINTYRVSGSNKRTAMSLADGAAWFKEGRSKKGAYRTSYSSIPRSEQAKILYWNLGDRGDNSKPWITKYPVFNFLHEVRPKSGVSMKPKTIPVPIVKPATSQKNLRINPFGGWGFLNWSKPARDPEDDENRPELSMDISITQVDSRGNKTSNKKITVPYDLDTDSESNSASIKALLEDKGIHSLKGDMQFSYKNKLYTLQPDSKAYITLKDTGGNKESLLKLKGFGFNMRKSQKAVSTLEVPIPSMVSPSKWEIVQGLDVPAWEQLRFYLGGYEDTAEYNRLRLKGDAKYTNSTSPEFSNAKLTLNVKAEVLCFDPKNPACVDEANADIDVPQWRLSKYTPDISPDDKSKSMFSLSFDSTTGHSQELSNSGLTNFSLVDPDLSDVKWAESKAKWFKEKSQRSIGVATLFATFNVGGDMLAIKENQSVSNIKLASWLSQRPILNGKIDTASTGSTSDNSLVTKKHDFTYGVNSGHKEYKYSDKRYEEYKDKDGKEQTRTVTYSETKKPSYIKSTYDTQVKFSRYNPDKSDKANTFSNKEKSSNGLYWETIKDKQTLNINPEVLMAYDDASGNTSVAFVAGDRLRQVNPVHYNSAQFVSVAVDPKVQGMSTATSQPAKDLLRRLQVNGLAVAYKGSSLTTNFDIKGQLELKTYSIDIGASALKNAWGNSTYSTDSVNEEFLRRHATKGADGKWTVKFDATGKMIIGAGSNPVGGQQKVVTAKQKAVNLKEHTLVIRGGNLTSVDGNSNLSALPKNLKDALVRMNISVADNNIFNTFESEEGSKLSESKVATLGNAVRGTNDLAVGKGWYNEDTTVLVVREYTNVFELPNYLYVDKIPMKIAGLETPANKMDFFKTGKIGYTLLQLEVAKAQMTYDASKPTTFGGTSEKSFIVPNVSVLDTFQ